MGITDMTDILGSSLLSGAIIRLAPQVFHSYLKQYWNKITFQEALLWVNENRSLWEAIPFKYQKTLQEYGPKLGKMEWLTADWVMEAGKESAPSIYSLFAGWPEGKAWLQNQANDIKSKIKGVRAP